MSVVQNTYPDTLSAGADGQIVQTATWDTDSYQVQDDVTIPWGRAVKRDTDGKISLGAGTTATFAGISVKDPTRPAAGGDNYTEGALAAVLYRGDIWVKVKAAVVANGIVTSNAAGELSSTAVSATQPQLVGARFLTAAGAGKLAIVRLTGATTIATS